MQSLKELFRYGMGPSSSHTMGPRRAAELFQKRCSERAAIKVTLFGSLARTGKGHLTDKAVVAGLAPLSCEIIWSDDVLPFHPNGMRFEAFNPNGGIETEWTVFSVGGGELREAETGNSETPKVYTQNNMKEIISWADSTGKPIHALVEEVEGDGMLQYLEFVWKKMDESIHAGLDAEGCLPGGLKLRRKARDTFAQAGRLRKDYNRTGLLASYALAVTEQNAAGGFVVTAPTCGSCGVLPAVLFYLCRDRRENKNDILNALATAGMVGNVVKQNASISGAEVGCQGEVGVACAMAAAAAAQLLGASPHQIEYAAEIGLEHHLGLTCDPVLGLVQIPCIERNVFAAVSALACAEYALLSDGRHVIGFDQVVEAMNETGHDLPSLYRETAMGGLAKVYL